MAKKKSQDASENDELQAADASDQPCTCSEVEQLGAKMPCPSCAAQGLSGWRGAGVRPS